MKVLVLRSDYEEVPLAEIRTDGRLMEFVVDNTHGKLAAKIGNTFGALQAYVKNSSHLTLTEAKTATVNLLRYVMNNGDVVEITSDGHTVILNGNLLSQEEKDALMAAVKRGEIKVQRKTDITQAIPVMPASQPVQQEPVKTKLNPEIMQAIRDEQEKKASEAEMNSVHNDQEIEQADLSDSEDQSWTKRMMYWLKYGDAR